VVFHRAADECGGELFVVRCQESHHWAGKCPGSDLQSEHEGRSGRRLDQRPFELALHILTKRELSAKTAYVSAKGELCLAPLFFGDGATRYNLSQEIEVQGLSPDRSQLAWPVS